MKPLIKNKNTILITKKIISILFCLLLAVSCKNSSTSIDELQTPELTPVVADNVEVKIKNWTPVTSPVVFTSTNSTTYAVALEDGAGAVTYKYLLDNTIILQNSSSPFYLLDGSSLSLGAHTLQVIATNSRSSDSKTFALRRNTPTSVLSYAPTEALSILNCDQDTLTMSAVTFDSDNDSYSYKWLIDGTEITSSTAYTVLANTASSAQVAYTPGCAVAGLHQFSLVINDGYETTTKTWSVNAVDPSVETITSYSPSSNNITALSTDTSKVFYASGSGVGALTFIWKLDNATVKTDVGVSTSTYTLNTTSGILATGNHTLSVILSDSITSNDPALPVSHDWVIYKNQKPTILSPIPSIAKLINLNSPLAMSATIQDAGDTLTTTITKGALDCVPSSECGLNSVVLPMASGNFSATFSAGTAFLGENIFQLKVTDSYGEYATADFTVTANYFSDVCNSLGAGKICTIAGLPGLGGGINVSTESNKIRITPAWMTQDELGNWFFSDHATNTVWYYNKSSSPVTLWGTSAPSATVVAAHSLYVVAGTGIAGNGSLGQSARKVALNFNSYGGGLSWDSDRRELYIADYSNSRVIRINQSGVASALCGSGALNTQGTSAVNHQCSSPVDVEMDSTNRRLYVSAYGQHLIKYFDVSDASSANWKGYMLAGLSGSNASTNGTTNLTAFPATTIAGTSRLSGPWGLYLDRTDSILYVAEYASCRIRALGLPGSTSQTIGTATVTAGNLVTLAGSACAAPAVNTDILFSANIASKPFDLVVEKSGASVKGIYISDNTGARVSYMNNTGGSVTIGNQAIASQRLRNVFGNGTATATNPPSGKTYAIQAPVGLYLASNILYVGARGNNTINSIDVSVANGTPSLYIGGTARASYSGNAAIDSKIVTFNNPLTLHYKDTTNQLFVSDSVNAMIRAINLTTGRVEDFIGTGAVGDENLLNTVTTSTRMRSPRGMAIYGDFFLYADGANNNNFIRAYNTLANDQTLFNTIIYGNRTNTVAGYYLLTGNFSGTAARSTTDPLAALGLPYGLGVDVANDSMYITSISGHCLLRVQSDTPDALIVPVLGTCGTIAGSISLGGSYGDTNLLLNNPAEIVMDPLNTENFFFVDWSANANAHVKYVNTSAGNISFFAGAENVAANSVGTVLAATSSPGFIRALAAHGDWICFTSGTTTVGQGNNTVVCKDRVSGNTKGFGTAGAGGIQSDNEQEGFSADGANPAITFAAPSGLAFDSNGNLYISEQGSHVIRMIKKWW